MQQLEKLMLTLLRNGIKFFKVFTIMDVWEKIDKDVI